MSMISAGTPACIYREINQKSLPGSFGTPGGALHDQFLAIPPSHFTHLKVNKIMLMGLRELTDSKIYLLREELSKENFLLKNMTLTFRFRSAPHRI